MDPWTLYAVLSLQFGEILCQYEVEKKLAIEREDYETAKDKKVRERGGGGV